MTMKLGSPEYNALKSFFRAAIPVFFPRAMGKEADPVEVLEWCEKQMPAVAPKSLRLGVDDLLTQMTRLSPDQIVELEKALATGGCMTVGEVMRKTYAKRLPALLARKKLRNEVDCYFLKSVMEDASVLDDGQTEAADALLNDYEDRAAASGRRRKTLSEAP